MRPRSLLALLVFALPFHIEAQSHFTPGEVVVSGSATFGEDPVMYVANLRVHHGDGSFARELATSPHSLNFREPLALNDTAFVPTRTPDAIARFAADGTPLAPFTTAVARVNYLSPGKNGGIIAANASGEVYLFAANGTLLAFRDFTNQPSIYGGIDLARDGCTLYFASEVIGRWNTCTNTQAELFGADFHAALTAFRVLPDGSFLVAGYFPQGQRVLHVANDGATILRTYPFPALAVALDIDGTSFWTNAGNYLLKVDIASGTVLSQTFTEFLIEGIAVAGEPRAALAVDATNIPTSSTTALIVLLLSIAAVAILRLQGS